MNGPPDDLARRTIERELLDDLAPSDPAALANRRDLRLLNEFGGNFRWLRRRLRGHLPAGARVLELGAGDGALAARVRPGLPAGLHWTGLDRLAPAGPTPAVDAWVQADLREFDGFGEYDAVVVNLLLHQLGEEELWGLAERLGRAERLRYLWIQEPLRARRAERAFALAARVLRFCPVSLHDGPVSIRAGFRPGELAPLLDPAGRWRWREQATLRGLLRVQVESL